jgi:putative thymidine phosphorylase
MDTLSSAREAIQKKLVGKRLTYKEIYTIMDEISHQRLGDILTTYFAASGYSQGFTNEEIYSLTRAMIETGEHLTFKGIVADKHSVGGIPGTRKTMIVVPIVAAAGFTIPKSSSRAITTPGGTADDMEVLAPVTFTKQQIYRIVEKTNACIVWGGSVDIAPADDELIKVEKPLMFESFDKVLVSIMAKKIAFGSNHIIIDLPYGKFAKIHRHPDAETIRDKFMYLAERFSVKMQVNIHKTDQPAGRGIGPILETREVLKVLEQTTDRPTDLEAQSVSVAGKLLDLCLTDADPTLRNKVAREFGNGEKWAKALLATGAAHQKLQEIIKAQGGRYDITSTELRPGRYSKLVCSTQSGIIKKINCKNVSILAKILGAPKQKRSGMYLERKIGDSITKREPLVTFYSESEYHLREALDSINHFPIIEWEK